MFVDAIVFLSCLSYRPMLIHCSAHNLQYVKGISQLFWFRGSQPPCSHGPLWLAKHFVARFLKLSYISFRIFISFWRRRPLFRDLLFLRLCFWILPTFETTVPSSLKMQLQPIRLMCCRQLVENRCFTAVGINCCCNYIICNRHVKEFKPMVDLKKK